jgi:DNA-binding LytR/AlgR family response regulator
LLALENSGVTGKVPQPENPEPYPYLKTDKEIMELKSKKEYPKRYLENSKVLLVKRSISSPESLLWMHRFVRVHHCYIIAIRKIRSFTSLHINAGTDKGPIGRHIKMS